MTDRCEVAVVGGGPVGLFLAARLTQQGIDARVLEKDSVLRLMSRAVGIHPHALRCMSELGVSEQLIARGVPVRKGHAFAGRRELGQISFSALPQPFDFVLTVPQHDTEAVLSRCLEQHSPGALLRGAQVIGLLQGEHSVILCFEKEGKEHILEADFVVGCDGRNSIVRESLRADFRGGPYPSHFIMGDVPDDTSYGRDAAVFLSSEGLVESFPLPLSRRRWVVSTGKTLIAPEAGSIGALVERRTGHILRSEEAFLVSSFAAEHYLSSRLAVGRVALAGDAAHLVSPIGGQGMNLGWLDAFCLADALEGALCKGQRHEPLLLRYERERMRRARSAKRRAEWFMAIGKGVTFHAPRDTFVRWLLSPWLAPRAAGLLTMHAQ